VDNVRVGVQLHPQHCTIDDLRSAWRRADAAGLDSIWIWDHFYPLYGEPDGPHFEGWSLLSAMAADTERARLGVLVSCNTYRNPDLLADMARTVDQISGGRVYLGIGAGWFERDYAEYGYGFSTARGRLDALEESLQRITARVQKLDPPPVGPLPIIIGGAGEKVTLRLVAQYADAWNMFGTPEEYTAKCSVLDGWCDRLGRDPAEIERTVLLLDQNQADNWRDHVTAGATHLIYAAGAPFDLAPVERLRVDVLSS
jgi:probable F420-dependent oxidoreductase